MRHFVVCLMLACAPGCGVASMSPESYQGYTSRQPNAPAQDAPAGGGAGVSESAVPKLERRIIYNGNLQLAVEDFTPIPARIDQLIATYGIIVADSSITGSPGQPRNGTWKLRVPVERFHSLVDDLRSLGELVSEGKSSQDVSERYYDLQARIKNKKLQEQRLLKMMEENATRLTELLQLEEHVTRVRGEIEQMEGQLRVLADLTDLATLTLTINEVKGYRPPEAPTFGRRIGRSWEDSLQGLTTLGQGITIAAVYAAPWLPLFLLPLLAFYVLMRRLLRGPREPMPRP